VGSLTYGFIHAASDGWADPITLAAFAAAVVFLAAFIAIESRTEQPLMPLRLFANRTRSGGNFVMLTIGAALFAMFFFLTQYVQEILGYSPLKAGFAFLPVSITIIIVAQICSRLIGRIASQWLIASGAALATVGLLWMAQIGMHSSYLTLLLPAMVVIAIGMGLLFVPITLVAVSGVEDRDAGIASAMLNVMQQVGGTLGLSSLVTVSATAIRNDINSQVAALTSKLPSGAPPLKPTATQQAALQNHALVHGWSTGFEVGAIFTVVGMVVALVAIRVPVRSKDPEGELQPEPV
jgi:predicted MFS family arabinose efflux permease